MNRVLIRAATAIRAVLSYIKKGCAICTASSYIDYKRRFRVLRTTEGRLGSLISLLQNPRP